MKEDERRKCYFIKKDFQRNFIIKFCLLVLLGSLISGAIIYLMSRATVTTTFLNSRLTIKSTADFILPAVLLSSLVVIICVGLSTIAVVLFTSHKIAGPLYHLEKDVEELGKGNLKARFTLRQGDEIKAMAENLAQAAANLRAKVNSIKNSFSGLKNSLMRLEKDGVCVLSKEIKEELAQLEAGLGELNS